MKQLSCFQFHPTNLNQHKPTTNEKIRAGQWYRLQLPLLMWFVDPNFVNFHVTLNHSKKSKHNYKKRLRYNINQWKNYISARVPLVKKSNTNLLTRFVDPNSVILNIVFFIYFLNHWEKLKYNYKIRLRYNIPVP